MVTAIVVLDRRRIQEVAEALAGIDGVSEVGSVAGQHALAATFRVKDNEALADLVTGRMPSSETLIAFRPHSRHDIESLSSVGTGD